MTIHAWYDAICYYQTIEIINHVWYIIPTVFHAIHITSVQKILTVSNKMPIIDEYKEPLLLYFTAGIYICSICSLQHHEYLANDDIYKY